MGISRSRTTTSRSKPRGPESGARAERPPAPAPTEDEDMECVLKRTRVEQETLFRLDCEERVLWASTTTPYVAHWTRVRIPVVVLSRYPDGTAATWAAKLPWTGARWRGCGL